MVWSVSKWQCSKMTNNSMAIPGNILEACTLMPSYAIDLLFIYVCFDRLCYRSSKRTRVHLSSSCVNDVRSMRFNFTFVVFFLWILWIHFYCNFSFFLFLFYYLYSLYVFFLRKRKLCLNFAKPVMRIRYTKQR